MAFSNTMTTAHHSRQWAPLSPIFDGVRTPSRRADAQDRL